MWLFKDANKTSVTVRPGSIVQKKPLLEAFKRNNKW